MGYIEDHHDDEMYEAYVNKDSVHEQWVKAEIKSLRTFLEFIDNSHKREPVKFSINFQHRRFEENKGFAILTMKDRSNMRKVLNGMKKNIEDLIDELTAKLKEYEQMES